MSYRLRVTTRAALALLFGATAACGSFSRKGPPPPSIVFVNQSLNQADVYAASPGGGVMRIGTVMPGRTEVLRLRNATAGSGSGVSIIARVVSTSRAPRTGTLTLSAGERLQVTLPLSENTLTVLPVIDPEPEP